ncbi:hypothetical protein ASG11_10125 [Sphingomonas sp. Leaf357]|uniref:RcnB family protein n=1 Tax=Sphingomonas sp. Leaf357 TaxID=1736350 RepID=UPI0006F60D93|nr:RcnB family protein [Sphingomonas sp. Leaf357]KQS04564.1 hypothetical protein ASG11_10125 [Sphingomonas sp. Leaf357]
MRISILAALMAATAFVPGAALAQRMDRGDNDRGDRQARVEARADARAERPERPVAEQPRAEQPRPDQPRFDRGNGGGGWNRGNRPDRGQPDAQPPRPQPQADQPRPQPQAQFSPDRNRGGRPDVRGGNGQGGGQWRGDRGDRGPNPNAQGGPGYRGDRGDRVATPERRNDWRGNDNRGGDWRGTADRGNDWRGNAGRNDNRFAGRGGNDRGAWNRNWRGDTRYDWSRRRQYDRNAFHLPRYYAPRGWNYGYRRFSIGLTLNAGLFANNYWIDDPYGYGLPEAYGPYRWVRYYNDALLVDIYSGEVVDTVYDIFW